MLADDVERYLSIRKTLGFKLHKLGRQLRQYARFAGDRGDNHVRASSALAWATMAPSPSSRHRRMRGVAGLARFLHAEDVGHEVPSASAFQHRSSRPLPYIYTPAEIVRLLEAARRLRCSYPLRRDVYATLLGLIASTGLRISEALDLRLDDVQPDGVLRIRSTKFGKSRLVPLHPTVREALRQYLDVRGRAAVTDDHVFLSASERRIGCGILSYTFSHIRKLAGIEPARARAPRIHDLRHTFATRSLEACPADRRVIGRHFVALATYLGHVEARSTWWYLEATPELMTDIASAAGALMREGRP